MTDRLDLANAIEAAGIERKAAEHIAAMIFDAIRENVATKADIAELRIELKSDTAELRAELKSDIAELRAELKSDIAELRAELKSDTAELRAELKSDIAATHAELKADIAAVNAKVDLVEHRLLFRLGSLIVVVVGLLFAALHYWPPHG